MSAKCVHCRANTATRHCEQCRQGFTCHQKSCEIAFNVTHICNKTKREREEGEEEEEDLRKKPDMLETLFRRYKDIVQAIIKHLDTWDDVRNICNTNQVMRKACAEFKQLSGGIWQFLLRLYFPFDNMSSSVRALWKNDWPAWAVKNPQAYFNASIVSVYIKYGGFKRQDTYRYDVDKLIRENYHPLRSNQTFTMQLKNSEGDTFDISVRPHIWKYEDDEDSGDENDPHYWTTIKLEIQNVKSRNDNLIADMNKLLKMAADGNGDVDVSKTFNENGDYIDIDGAYSVSLEKLVKFFYNLQVVYGYSWNTFRTIPKIN